MNHRSPHSHNPHSSSYASGDKDTSYVREDASHFGHSFHEPYGRQAPRKPDCDNEAELRQCRVPATRNDPYTHPFAHEDGRSRGGDLKREVLCGGPPRLVRACSKPPNALDDRFARTR